MTDMWKYVTLSRRRGARLDSTSARWILLVLALIGSSSPLARDLTLELNHKTYRIELADTPEQRRQGLMFRQRLAPDEGMLLVYRDSGDHRIWMKNMLIPIRVYWINADLEVVAMRRLEPCAKDPCPVYSSRPATARFVLELGDYEHLLEPGDRINGLSDL